MDIQELLKSLGLSVARGVPQMASGFVDLAALPFTATGLLKPEQAVGSTDWMTARGYLPPKQEGLLSESAEMASSMLSPAGATKAGLLALGMAAAKGKGGKAMNSILKTQYDEAMEVAQKNAALPVSEGGLGLPPDNTAMDRARALGFDTPAYHGTVAGDIDKFAQNTRGVYFTSPDASFANRYTIDAAGKTVESSNVIPLMVRTNNPFDYQNKIDVKALSRKASLGSLAESQIKKGDWRRLEDRTTIDIIKNMGKGGVYVNEDGVKNLAVFNPNQLRSRFAAFDPMKRNLPDILAGLGATGIGLGLLAPQLEEEQY